MRIGNKTLLGFIFALLLLCCSANAWANPGAECGTCDSGESCVDNKCYPNCNKDKYINAEHLKGIGASELGGCACTGGVRGAFGWQPICKVGQICYNQSFWSAGKNTCSSVSDYINYQSAGKDREDAKKRIEKDACIDGDMRPAVKEKYDDPTEYFCIGVDNKYIGGFASGCKTIPAQVYEDKACFFCPLFFVLYNAADEMSWNSFDKMSPPFRVIIIMGLAIWIAFVTLNHVGSLTKQDAPKYLGNLLKQSFKVLIVFFMLMNSDHVYNLIVNPLLQSSLEMGTTLLDKGSAGKVSESGRSAGGKCFSSATYNKLEAFTSAVQQEIAVMQSVGKSLMCVGSNQLFSLNFGRWGSAFMMVVQGLVIAAFAFLLSLAFGFYLIDAIVQLGIVGAIIPFLILCWPFKLTSKYTGKGFDIFLNSCFVFIFMAIAIDIDFKLVGAALTQNTSVSTPDAQCKATVVDENGKIKEKSVPCGNFALIHNAINNSDFTTLKKITDIGGVGFLILLACCIFGFKFVGKVSGLAGQMASGAISGIGSSIGTMAASAIKSAAGKIAAPTTNAIKEKVGGAMESGAKALGNAVVKAPVNIPRYAMSKSFRQKVNQSTKEKFDKAFGANTTAAHAQQKATAKQLANAVDGANYSKRQADGSRSVDYRGSSATIGADGKVSFNSNVTKIQNKDGSMSYQDSKSGKKLTDKQVQEREASKQKLEKAFNGGESAGNASQNAPSPAPQQQEQPPRE